MVQIDLPVTTTMWGYSQSEFVDLPKLVAANLGRIKSA